MAYTFSELDMAINRLLAQDAASLKNIAQDVAEYSDLIDSEKWKALISEFDRVNLGRDSIAEYVRQLFEKAVVDRTGLHTRLYFDEWLRECEGDQHLAYVMCDIDKFHD